MGLPRLWRLPGVWNFSGMGGWRSSYGSGIRARKCLRSSLVPLYTAGADRRGARSAAPCDARPAARLRRRRAHVARELDLERVGQWRAYPSRPGAAPLGCLEPAGDGSRGPFWPSSSLAPAPPAPGPGPAPAVSGPAPAAPPPALGPAPPAPAPPPPPPGGGPDPAPPGGGPDPTPPGGGGDAFFSNSAIIEGASRSLAPAAKATNIITTCARSPVESGERNNLDRTARSSTAPDIAPTPILDNASRRCSCKPDELLKASFPVLLITERSAPSAPKQIAITSQNGSRSRKWMRHGRQSQNAAATTANGDANHMLDDKYQYRESSCARSLRYSRAYPSALNALSYWPSKQHTIASPISLLNRCSCL